MDSVVELARARSPRRCSGCDPIRASARLAASCCARMGGLKRPAALSGATARRSAICAMPRRWRRKRISCATSISVRPRSCWCAPICCAGSGASTRRLRRSAAPMPICACAIAEAGSRVVYDPAVVVTGWSRSAAVGEPGEAQQALFRKHADLVAVPPWRRPPRRVFARSTDTARACAVHRRHDSAAPAWLGLRALERPDPGDGDTRLSRHGLSDQPDPRRSCNHLRGHARHGRGDARPLTRGAGGLPGGASGLLRHDLDRAHAQPGARQADAGTRSRRRRSSRRASCWTPRRSSRCARPGMRRLPMRRHSMSMRRSCRNSRARMSARAIIAVTRGGGADAA